MNMNDSVENLLRETQEGFKKFSEKRDNVEALVDAMNSPEDWTKNFRSNWNIAKAFNDLGAELSLFDAQDMSHDRAKVYDEWGCKMTYRNPLGRETIVVPGRHGWVFFGLDKHETMVSGYEYLLTDEGLKDELFRILNVLMQGGYPIFGFIEALDDIVNRGAGLDSLKTTLEWFNKAFSSIEKH